jgi:hypothetical protein
MESDQTSCSNRTKSSPSVRWYAHLAGDLGDTVSDVLILLDCCSSGGSRGHATTGNKELIAACGFETFCPAPGKHSFTDSLIEELWDLSNGPAFSAAHLHDRISARLQRWSPYYDADNLNLRDKEGRDIERRNAPVHFLMNSQVDNSSIVLRPLSPPSTSSSNGEDPGASTGPPLKRPRLLAPTRRRVLISVVMGEDYQDATEAISTWLRRIPGKVDSVSIEAAFDHGSSLLLVSMPVAVWDLLPSHQAYSFVGFVRSENLLLPTLSADQPLSVPEDETPRIKTEKSSGSIKKEPSDIKHIDEGLSSSYSDALQPLVGDSASSDKHSATQVPPQPLSLSLTLSDGVSPGSLTLKSRKAYSTRRISGKWIYNPEETEFLTCLEKRNIGFSRVTDEMGKSFWVRSLTNPHQEPTVDEEERWENDLLESHDLALQIAIHGQMIRDLTLSYSLAYARNSEWWCDPVPSKDEASEYHMPLPRPGSVVAFQAASLLLSEYQPRDLGKLARLMCPIKTKGTNNSGPALPFFSMESYSGTADESAIRRNLNTASQALNNMYLILKAAGRKNYETIFFDKVRFYSAVASTTGFELRAHRAVKLGEGSRIQPDYPLWFQFDRVVKVEGVYTKREVSIMVEKVLSYGDEILRPIFVFAVNTIAKKMRADHMPFAVKYRI